jgi:hypothetical protein
MEKEGLYLIKEREFTKTGENVYKIGRSNNVKNRMNNYPKGSDIELMIACNDSKKSEKNIINKFKTQFKQKTEYGNEYFEGNKNAMINTIIKENTNSKINTGYHKPINNSNNHTTHNTYHKPIHNSHYKLI